MQKLNLNAVNTIDMTYECNYDNDGSGLHSFVDISDKNQYIYS